ncbi:Phage lysozyme [compost metagenome]
MARISAAHAGGENVLAFLDLLAWSEGTDNGRQPTKDAGYDVVVGGGLFAGYHDHPRRLVTLPRIGIKSTAAGRYQLLSRYWDAYRKQLGLEDFSPVSQDRVALQQIRERRALADVQAGRIEAAIGKCRNIWASLPGAGYGQHEQKLGDLLARFESAGGVIA